MSVLINFFSSLNINIKWRYAIAKCHANINLIITKIKNCKDLQTNTSSCFQITKSNYVEYTLKIKITFLEGGIKHDKPIPSLS
jgi:hypothetical protein